MSGHATGWRARIQVLQSPAQSLLDDLVTTIFPAECRCCDAPLEQAGSVPVCEACVARIVPNPLQGCPRCGDASDRSLSLEDTRFAAAQGAECRACKASPPDFVRAVSFGVHEAELRDLIALLKFNRVRAVAPFMAARLAQAILQLQAQASADLLVIAVPLFPARQRWRGFNQSVLLADSALRQLRTLRPAWKLKATHSSLQRVRETESSFRLSPRGRRENLRGAFRVAGDVFAREVLLIDDIYTSGATARECARVLVRAGAARVWVATLARAQKESATRQHEAAADSVAMWDLKPTAAL